MSEELKPCPFCGSRDVGGVGGKASDRHQAYSYINCYGCKTDIKYKGGIDNAIKAWNTRNHDKLIEQIEGMKVYKDHMIICREHDSALDDVIKLIRGVSEIPPSVTQTKRGE